MKKLFLIFIVLFFLSCAKRYEKSSETPPITNINNSSYSLSYDNVIFLVQTPQVSPTLVQAKSIYISSTSAGVNNNTDALAPFSMSYPNGNSGMTVTLDAAQGFQAPFCALAVNKFLVNSGTITMQDFDASDIQSIYSLDTILLTATQCYFSVGTDTFNILFNRTLYDWINDTHVPTLPAKKTAIYIVYSNGAYGYPDIYSEIDFSSLYYTQLNAEDTTSLGSNDLTRGSSLIYLYAEESGMLISASGGSGYFDLSPISGLRSMARINLSGSKITTIPTGLFMGLGNSLTEVRLDAQEDELSTLPKGVFDGLSNLVTLNLKRTGLK